MTQGRGKNVLITGASGGIGMATALYLAEKYNGWLAYYELPSESLVKSSACLGGGTAFECRRISFFRRKRGLGDKPQDVILPEISTLEVGFDIKR